MRRCGALSASSDSGAAYPPIHSEPDVDLGRARIERGMRPVRAAGEEQAPARIVRVVVLAVAVRVDRDIDLVLDTLARGGTDGQFEGVARNLAYLATHEPAALAFDDAHVVQLPAVCGEAARAEIGGVIGGRCGGFDVD